MNSHNELYKKYFDEAVECIRKEKKDLARENFLKAIELKPEDPNLHGHLAWYYFNLGNLDKAIEEYKQVISLSPNDSEAYFRLGDVYFRLGYIKEARRCYRKSLQIEPNQLEVVHQLSQATLKKQVKQLGKRILKIFFGQRVDFYKNVLEFNEPNRFQENHVPIQKKYIYFLQHLYNDQRNKLADAQEIIVLYRTFPSHLISVCEVLQEIFSLPILILPEQRLREATFRKYRQPYKYPIQVIRNKKQQKILMNKARLICVLDNYHNLEQDKNQCERYGHKSLVLGFDYMFGELIKIKGEFNQTCNDCRYWLTKENYAYHDFAWHLEVGIDDVYFGCLLNKPEQPCEELTLRFYLIDEIAQFLKVSVEKLRNRLARRYYLTHEGYQQWRKAGLDKQLDSVKIHRYYQNINEYIFDGFNLYNYPMGARFYHITPVLRYVQKKAKILDYGSGTGINAIALTELGYRVTAADVGGPHFDFLQWRFKIRNIPGDFFNLSIDSPQKLFKSFDAIIFYDVLEHIVNWKDTLSLLHQFLLPKGILFIQINISDSMFLHISERTGLTSETYETAMNQIGFQKIAIPKFANVEAWRKE